jgi:hypothetical protein
MQNTPRPRITLARTTRWLILAAISASTAAAQTADDGLMIPKKTLMMGVMYAHDSWDQYWEGTLRRTNGNIGTLTTQSTTLVGGYGLTDRLQLMATLPYIETHASQGVLHGLKGFQDLNITAKLRLFGTGPTNHGAFSSFIAATGATPVGKYTPDFFPLSIGTDGRRASAHLALNYQSNSVWFANAAAAYMFCANVRLNRNAYYTNGQLFLTNEVQMPNVLDYMLSAGFDRGNWRVPVTLVQQRTLGGGDIRRQDMPFVSNRMDFVRLGGDVIYGLPKNLSVQLGAAHVLSGRNVGESTTFTSGLMYALHI